MKLTMRPFQNEADYWRIRNFLREIFLTTDGLEYYCHVALLDHWRWHYILTCQETGPLRRSRPSGKRNTARLRAVLHPICHDEVRLHVHPHFRTPALEDEIIAYAEEHHSDWYEGGQRILYLPVFADDTQRQETLVRRGFKQRPGADLHWQRDLDAPIPEVPIPPGYEIRSMGAEDELPARSWASWRRLPR